MKTISLKLPDDVNARIAAAARRSGVSKSAFVRQAIEDRLRGEQQGRPTSAFAQAKDLAGCLDGPPDLSTGEEHLEGYGE